MAHRYCKEDNLLVKLVYISVFRFQVDPSSPYAKPLKNLNAPSKSCKKGQFGEDFQQVQADCIKSVDLGPPEQRLDDQNLTEDQMAWRYSSKA